MAWKGVITNSGSELLAQWTAGKTLTITRAAAGTGRVSEAAMLAQTALVSEKQTASILSNKTTAQGQKLQLQVTPLATGYPHAGCAQQPVCCGQSWTAARQG